MQLTLPAAPSPATHVPSVQLLHGDCLDVLPTIDTGSVAMAFADLPYGVVRKSEWDQVIDLQAFWRLLSAVLWKSGVSALTATQPFATRVINSNIKRFKYDLIWNKKRGANIGCLKNMPLRTHESVLVFAEGRFTYNAQMWLGSGSTQRTQSGIYKKSNHVGFSDTCNRKTGSASGIRHPVSIIDAPAGRPQNSIHPTQKPVALLEWLIKTYTNLGDTVLDPVSGSATTAIAALRTGRNVICIEKDPAYFEVGRQRVAAEQARLGHPVTV